MGGIQVNQLMLLPGKIIIILYVYTYQSLIKTPILLNQMMILKFMMSFQMVDVAWETQLYMGVEKLLVLV